MALRSRPEERLQRSVAELLAWTAPPDLVWFAVPNQRGTRQRFEQAILTAMGLKPGVGDLCFVIPPMGRFGCIELKAGHRKPSRLQLDFAQACERAGALWACCWSVEDVIATLEGWGVLLRVAA
jgi:hypothetical protein